MSIYSIVIDKRKRKDDIFEIAWNTLLTRFENTIRNKNFLGPQNADERGMLISDNTDGDKLCKLVRRMRHYNPVPNRRDLYSGDFRNMKLEYVIEDPIFRDSKNSLIHQMNDVVAYFCRQLVEPNAYIKGKAGVNYYTRLSDVLITKVSRTQDGVVWI